MLKLIIFFLLALPLIANNELSSYCDCESQSDFNLNTADKLQFGRLWKQIQHLEETQQLDEMIDKRRIEIFSQKEHWRGKIQSLQSSEFHGELQAVLALGELLPASSGCGAAYILHDQEGTARFVIKPIDEDILCLNNRKFFASPYNDRAFSVRSQIPLYRSPQTEALSYRFAELLELTHLTPQTSLAIIASPSFHDISSRLDLPERAVFYQKTGQADPEKLCSFQRFLPHEKNLFDVIQDWVDEQLSEEQVQENLDQRDFEELMLFIWCIYDTDAHVGNFPALKDAKGIYHLKKIDNGLAFPNQNSNLFNVLYFLPQGRLKISKYLQERIAKLPIKEMSEAILYFEMEECREAFKERVEILQQLAERDSLTLSEIDMRLRVLQLPNGKEMALGNQSLSELEELVFQRSTATSACP